jgi:hypothetical protein
MAAGPSGLRFYLRKHPNRTRRSNSSFNPLYFFINYRQLTDYEKVYC